MPNPLPWFRLNADDIIDDDVWDLWPVENYGILLKLMVRCWKDPECSLPDDTFSLRCKVRIEDDPSDERFVDEDQLKAVLTLFVPHPDIEGRLTHPDLYRQFNHARNLSAVRSEIGKRGGRPPSAGSAPGADEKPIAKQKLSNSKPIAKQTESKPKADRIESREEGEEKREEESIGCLTTPLSPGKPETVAHCPYQAIVDLYHQTFPGHPRVRVLGEPLKKALRGRWREHPGITWWVDYFQLALVSDFLCGRIEGDPRPFLADLEFLTRPAKMAKILNDGYPNRSANPRLRSEKQRVNEATFAAMGAAMETPLAALPPPEEEGFLDYLVRKNGGQRE